MRADDPARVDRPLARSQAAERIYWQALGSDPIEFARVLTEKVEVAAWFERRLPVATGFGVLTSNRPSRPVLSQLVGHAHQSLLLAEKPSPSSTSAGGEP